MSETVEGTVIEASELATVIRENQIAPTEAQSLVDAFQPSFMEAKKLVDEAARLTVTDATQVTEIRASGKLRKQLKDVRTNANDIRKALKEDSLRRGNAIQGMYNVLLLLIEPAESRLMEQEKFAERKEAERKAALKRSREELLAPFGIDTSFYSLAEMPEPTFAQLFDSSRLSHEAMIERKRQIEADRIAAEASRIAEEKRIREENERLRLEQEAKDKELAAERRKAEHERLAAEARERAIRAESEQKALAERQAVEAREKAAKAKAKAERDAIEAKARQEREKIEAQAKADREARERAEQEIETRRQQEAADIAAAAEAKRLAAAAPDHDKLVAFAATVRALEVPAVSTTEAKIIANEIAAKVKAMATWIKAQAAKLSKSED